MGRSLPIWNSFGRVAPFTPDKPWLLRIFDQVRHYTAACIILDCCKVAMQSVMVAIS